MEDTWQHTTVLLNEAVSALVHDADGHYIDATFGRGGHSRAILQRLSPRGRLSAWDRDPQAVQHAQALSDARFSIRHEGFAGMARLEAGCADGILMDLGVSSPQIDDPARGFSFRADGPLDMRMDTTRGRSVAQWLAQADEREIAQVVRDYGEERFAGAVARAIVRHRDAHGAPQRTAELAQLVAGAVRTREAGQHPATRTFQAFRIFINAELDELRAALDASLRLLRPQGRLVVISFHSLEDRIVKTFIAAHSRDEVDRRAPFAPPRALALQALERVRPSEAEVAANPRARSAVMRVARRTDADIGTSTHASPQKRAGARAGGRA